MNGPSPHLSWAELACRDAARTPYPLRWRGTRAARLAAVFEGLRAYCGDQPLTVLSGYRTAAHNRRVGGARASQHVCGRAVDIRAPEGILSVVQFHRLAAVYAQEDTRLRGLGYYTWGIHVDIRPSARLIVWNMVSRNVGVHDVSV